jgi:hypothetical protein
MTQRGLSLEQIHQETGFELEVLKQFLPEVPFKAHAQAGRSPSTTNEESKEPQPTETLPKPQHVLMPTFFYCCPSNSSELHWVNLLTGNKSCHKVPGYQFNHRSSWCELPGGSLLITGGWDAVRDAVKIDTLREWAVSSLPPMHTARAGPAALYHSQYVYVLGGVCGKFLSECERYVCAESRWEVLPARPVAGAAMSAFVLDDSLYALGGYHCGKAVQKLCLDSLTWELMELKCPRSTVPSACFKTTQVYLVINTTLYSFTPLEVKPIKTLPQIIRCFSSYYSRGTLYYERGERMESCYVGELTSP